MSERTRPQEDTISCPNAIPTLFPTVLRRRLSVGDGSRERGRLRERQ